MKGVVPVLSPVFLKLKVGEPPSPGPLVSVREKIVPAILAVYAGPDTELHLVVMPMYLK